MVYICAHIVPTLSSERRRDIDVEKSKKQRKSMDPFLNFDSMAFQFFQEYLNKIQTSGEQPPEIQEETKDEKPVIEKPLEVFTNAHITVIESFQPQVLTTEIPKAANIKELVIHDKKPKVVTLTTSSLRRILRKQFFEVARPMAIECNLGDRSFDMSERYDV